MNILYISEIYPDVKRGLGVWGGGERQFYEISKRVADLGHDVTVLTCRFPGQPAEEMVDGVRVVRYGLSRNAETGGARKVILPIFSYIFGTSAKTLKIKPDVIHCNTYFPVYAGVIASQFDGIALVSTFHDVYGLKGWINSQGSYGWGILGHLATTVASKLPNDRLIAVSPQCKQKLLGLGVPSEKISVIQNGVDLKLFDSIEVEKVPNQVLYVGRLVNFKHVDWLIQAFAQVLKVIPSATLKIVGSGPAWATLHKMVKKMGLQSHVIFTGKTPTYEAVTTYFKESELFVLPSVVEGEAIVLKEAMAAGLPILAMNVPGSGVLSLVMDGKNGFLLKPGQPTLIAEKIIELLKNNQQRKKMGLLGRNFVEKYDWNIMADRTIHIYKEIAKK